MGSCAPDTEGHDERHIHKDDALNGVPCLRGTRAQPQAEKRRSAACCQSALQAGPRAYLFRRISFHLTRSPGPSFAHLPEVAGRFDDPPVAVYKLYIVDSGCYSDGVGAELLPEDMLQRASECG